jgi:hypothetical protein
MTTYFEDLADDDVDGDSDVSTDSRLSVMRFFPQA